MVIKIQERWSCFFISYNYGYVMTTCKTYLKSSKYSSKIYQIFARIPYNSYFGNTSKYDASDSKEAAYREVPL